MMRRTAHRLAALLALLLSLAAGSGAQPTGDGQYLEAEERIVTLAGEVAVDYANDEARLPEELDDGELEGGDQHTMWSYQDQARWRAEYPQCEGERRRQSPIDIRTDQVVFDSTLKLDFLDYDQEVEFEFKNTHHSVSMTPISSLATPSIRASWVAGGEQLYELQEIHFHWGNGRLKGSEHEINDQRAAAEMHMVHYRRGLNKSQIGSVENSVVVIGVLVESDAHEHNKLEALVKRTSFVNGTDREYKCDHPENLISMLPDNHQSFFAYNGSLTTPPCYEVVSWVIMSEPVYMSQAKLEELTNLEMLTNGRLRQKISSNFRDIQPLLERPVYASFNTSDTNTYQLSSEAKRRTGRFTRAFDDYWSDVNKLKVSVKRACKYVNEARKRLLLRLGAKKRPTTSKPPPHPPQQQQQAGAAPPEAA